MHFYARVHHWVVWWFSVGIVCGFIAVVNILTRDLTRTQDRVILAIGVLFWTLGGFVCHAYEGITFERPPERTSLKERTKINSKRWQPAQF
jgi:hypothetical protein